MTADKKAKILATLGPATRSRDDIRALVEAGANLFRLNFSHGDYADHAQRFACARGGSGAELPDRRAHGPAGSEAAGRPLRRRCRAIAAWADLHLDLSDAPGDERRVNLPHPEIIHALEPGMSSLLDDGKIRLEVVNGHSDAIETRVAVGGELSDRGRQRAGSGAQPSPLTDKDRRDPARPGTGGRLGGAVLRATPEDIDEARGLIGDKAFLAAKIEKPSAVSAIEAIAERADAIMVARGDLGERCRGERAGHPETHRPGSPPARQAGGGGHPDARVDALLPAPTRAEVTDAATAVGAGADAVMLGGNRFRTIPREAVEMMAKIVRQVEAEPDHHVQLEVNRPQPDATVSDAISCAIRRVSRILPVAVLN